MKTLARITALAIVASLIALLGVPAASAKGGDDERHDDDRSYTVTVTNLTDTQFFTPPAFAAHTARADIFDVGAKASPEIQQLAKNGDLGPLVAALADMKGVKTSGVGGGAGGAILAGTSRTFEFSAPRKARLFSAAQMVVCTNDGFTGLDSVRLPRHKGQTVRVYAFAWDAGTEMNTNSLNDFVPPCSGGATGTGMSNPELAEDGIIAPHPGLDGDVAEMFGFDPDSPVAVYEITRNADVDDDDDDDGDDD